MREQGDALETLASRSSDTNKDDDGVDRGTSTAKKNSSADDRPFLVDRYQLTKRLGRGGFGEVWQATDVSLDRQVAIKLAIFPASDQKRARRFLTEGRAAARLGHPNIAAVYDSGQVKQQYYLAVELINGQDLDKVIRQHVNKSPN